ncbi:arrestin red cell isoform X6 [Anopheles gambiae]|uniref:arrestin red cell isoform X6 n=1 Tax=Anopheles gambiae TaxID=7165 RepID=UPI002AC9C0B1|nr:arrestin red cell isoform X6 [Anopheles gambiae]XP_061509463.1 arrestin red cell isoform X6 [Anopheles gambiae]
MNTHLQGSSPRSPAPSPDPDVDEGSSKKQATRVFKKSSSNGKITVYLGKRDFVDHITHVDPIDGVVLIDPDYVKERKVFGHVLAAFRYGREDLDVLGLTFRKDLYLASEQIYPPLETDRPLTRLQERLIRKLGANAYPFYFEVPPHCPASVSLQPAPGDTGKPCGVDYELKAFVGESQEDKPHKRNSVRLAIRKIMYAPSKLGEQPSIEVSKEYILKPNKIHLEASLDKELYHHGESLSVNVHIANNSSKTVKKIKVSVRQFADICLFSTAQYKCTVAEVESEIADPSQRENLGIIVQYKVKVKLCITPLGGDLVAELPFILMHPKPDDDEPVIGDRSPGRTVNSADRKHSYQAGHEMGSHSNNGDAHASKEDGPNLIQLDGDDNGPDDDIIFEDFARLRLKGAETEA